MLIEHCSHAPLRSFVEAHWVRTGLHQAEFCRLVGMPAGWVQQIREGKKSMPLGKVDEWAEVMLLSPKDAKLLFDLSLCTHVPLVGRQRAMELVTGEVWE